MLCGIGAIRNDQVSLNTKFRQKKVPFGAGRFVQIGITLQGLGRHGNVNPSAANIKGVIIHFSITINLTCFRQSHNFENRI